MGLSPKKHGIMVFQDGYCITKVMIWPYPNWYVGLVFTMVIRHHYPSNAPTASPTKRTNSTCMFCPTGKSRRHRMPCSWLKFWSNMAGWGWEIPKNKWKCSTCSIETDNRTGNMMKSYYTIFAGMNIHKSQLQYVGVNRRLHGFEHHVDIFCYYLGTSKNMDRVVNKRMSWLKILTCFNQKTFVTCSKNPITPV